MEIRLGITQAWTKTCRIFLGQDLGRAANMSGRFGIAYKRDRDSKFARRRWSAQATLIDTHGSAEVHKTSIKQRATPFQALVAVDPQELRVPTFYDFATA